MIISHKKSTIVWSTIKVLWVWRCSRNDNVLHNYLSMNVILKFGPCILVTIISVKVIEKIIVTCLKCRSFGLTYSVLTSPTTPKMKNKHKKKRSLSSKNCSFFDTINIIYQVNVPND